MKAALKGQEAQALARLLCVIDMLDLGCEAGSVVVSSGVGH